MNDLTSRMQRLSYSPGNRALCKVRALLEKLPDVDTDTQVRQAIADDNITSTAIAAVMKSEGYDISAFSLRRHRRAECACAVTT